MLIISVSITLINILVNIYNMMNIKIILYGNITDKLIYNIWLIDII